MKFSGKMGNGPVNKWLHFGGHPDHRLDTGIVFRIRCYWEIRKVVNAHKSAAHSDSPDGGIGKTCLGGGMRCPITLLPVLLKLPNAVTSLLSSPVFIGSK